jgi:hypothetical protein
LGKGVLDVREVVMSEPSRTGRMGSNAPAEGSTIGADPKSIREKLRTLSVVMEFKHWVSVAEHGSIDLKVLRRVCCAPFCRKP